MSLVFLTISLSSTNQTIKTKQPIPPSIHPSNSQQTPLPTCFSLFCHHHHHHQLQKREKSNPTSSSEMVAEDHNQTLVFTYGTLKTGFSNHGLIQDMIRTGDAVFIGSYRTIQKYPLVCGPFRVPFLLNLPGKGDRIKGELYAVSEFGLTKMDELEGITKGHYERLPVEIIAAAAAEEEEELVKAVAYYGHRSYAEGLWKRNGEKGFCEYSKEETKGYVKRDCRPKNVSFLEQIRLFISSSSGFD